MATRYPCGFVDVGLNDGSTLFTWPRTALTVLPAGVPDIHVGNGTSRGAARWVNQWRSRLRLGLSRQSAERARNMTGILQECLADGGEGASQRACYYGFEANAAFTPQLRERQQQAKDQGHCVNLHLQTAFADRDGKAST